MLPATAHPTSRKLTYARLVLSQVACHAICPTASQYTIYSHLTVVIATGTTGRLSPIRSSQTVPIVTAIRAETGKAEPGIMTPFQVHAPCVTMMTDRLHLIRRASIAQPVTAARLETGPAQPTTTARRQARVPDATSIPGRRRLTHEAAIAPIVTAIRAELGPAQ